MIALDQQTPIRYAHPRRALSVTKTARCNPRMGHPRYAEDSASQVRGRRDVMWLDDGTPTQLAATLRSCSRHASPRDSTPPHCPRSTMDARQRPIPGPR
jgi:hypothetical protein